MTRRTTKAVSSTTKDAIITNTESPLPPLQHLSTSSSSSSSLLLTPSSSASISTSTLSLSSPSSFFALRYCNKRQQRRTSRSCLSLSRKQFLFVILLVLLLLLFLFLFVKQGLVPSPSLSSVTSPTSSSSLSSSSSSSSTASVVSVFDPSSSSSSSSTVSSNNMSTTTNPTTTTTTTSSTTSSTTMTTDTNNNNNNNNNRIVRVAHLGNSIQYYNDCPRLLQHMLQAATAKTTATTTTTTTTTTDTEMAKQQQQQQLLLFDHVYQNSCLRGGATLSSLFEKGNGMKTKFGTEDMGAATVVELLLQTQEHNNDNEVSSSLSSSFWDFIVLNDHTQSPARYNKRNETMESLQRDYIPIFQSITTTTTTTTTTTSTTSTTGSDTLTSSSPAASSYSNNDVKPKIIFLQTPAYKVQGIKQSQDLGTFEEFTTKIYQGYQEYIQIVPNSMIAPLGNAFLAIKQQFHDNNNNNNSVNNNNNTTSTDSSSSQQQQQPTLWEKLYARDDFHPSPHGTYLEACVLFCTMFPNYYYSLINNNDNDNDNDNNLYDISWWDSARYMQPKTDEESSSNIILEPLPLPTKEEAAILRRIACETCGVCIPNTNNNNNNNKYSTKPSSL